MSDEKKDDLESENQDNGGETVDKKTTEKEAEPDYKKIAEDQRKRAEIAEAKLKDKPKVEAEADLKQNNQTQSVDSDELRLIAKGLSDEVIDQAKVIAKGKGISLPEALKDPLLIAFQKDLKEQEKREKAKLGANKGSDAGEEKSFKKGMTEEEHKSAWKDRLGKK